MVTPELYVVLVQEEVPALLGVNILGPLPNTGDQKRSF